MTLHTDNLTLADLEGFARAERLELRPGAEERGSRSHERSFHRVRLYSPTAQYVETPWSGRPHRRRTHDASWDQHGDWMARVFDAEPDAWILTGATREGYRGRDSFNRQTGYAYGRAGMDRLAGLLYPEAGAFS